MKVNSIAVLAALAVLGTRAETETYTFSATNVYTANFGVPANWKTSAGDVATVAPTNGQDVVLPELLIMNGYPEGITLKTGGTTQPNGVPYLAYPSVSPTVGKLTGTHQYVIRHGESVTYSKQQPRRFTIADPDDFHGFFYACDALCYLTLPATAGYELQFPNVSGAARLHVEVPAAGTAASVESVYQGGAIEKNGAGNLKIKGLSGADADVYLADGSVEFTGEDADSSLEGLLRRSAVHFDPSVSGTLETFSSESLTCVARINDVRGREVFHAATNAYASSANLRVPYCHAPFISPSKSPTGLTLLDFGSKDGTTDYGPNYCFMELKEPVNAIREAFYVVETETTSRNCTILGSRFDNVYDFLKEAKFLFSAYQPCRHVWGGDLAINGERVVNTAVDPAALTNLYTVSVGTLDNARASMLGCERYYRNGTGGFRLGELLLFTNALTRAERVRINAYLNAKWRTGETVRDLGVVFAPNADVSVSVPSGRTVHARAAFAPQGLVKAGGGTLKVDRICPETAPVTLAGGDLAFGALPAVSSQVATNAYIWLDAQKTASVVTNDDGEVTQWNDCRADVSRAATLEKSDARRPTVTTVDGKAGIDFGLRTKTPATDACLVLPNWKGTANVYAGFLVVKSNGSELHNLFGSSDMTMYRNNVSNIVSASYYCPSVDSAHWALDGEPVDPLAPSAAQATRLNGETGWRLLSFIAQQPVLVDGISTDRGSVNGGQTVGEMILFDRPITTAERIGTEDYLMRRWINRPHPEAAGHKSLASVTYAAGTPKAISAEGTLHVATVAGGTAAVVKRGSGKVTMADAGDVASVTVEDGELVLPGKMSFIARDALFHFDADCDDSFLTEVGEDYAGKTVTNVVRWNDCRFNGVGGAGIRPPYATKTNLISALPTRILVETASGSYHRVLDLGARRLYDSTSAHTSAAGFNFDTAFTNVREIYGVVSDVPGYNQGWFWGDSRKVTYDYARAYSGGGLFCKDAASSVRDGDIRLNGVGGQSMSTVLPSGFNLFGVVATDNTTVSTFGLDRTYRAGAVRIGESLAFSRTLTDAERAFLEAYLKHKWLGGPAIVYTNAYDAVTVAAGAKLSFDGVSTAVAAGEIAGGGTVEAAQVIAGSLTTMALGAADFAPIRVSGTLTFAPDAVVAIPVAGRVRDLTPGKYALASAAAIENAAGVSVDSELTRHFAVALRVEGGVLYATLEKLGFVFIVR